MSKTFRLTENNLFSCHLGLLAQTLYYTVFDPTSLSRSMGSGNTGKSFHFDRGIGLSRCGIEMVACGRIKVMVARCLRATGTGIHASSST